MRGRAGARVRGRVRARARAWRLARAYARVEDGDSHTHLAGSCPQIHADTGLSTDVYQALYNQAWLCLTGFMTTTAAPEMRSDDGIDPVVNAISQAVVLLEWAGEQWSATAARAASEERVLAVNDAVTGARRTMDVLRATTSGEVGRRSGPELGVDGLARKRGFKNPAEMLATESGGLQGEARSFIEAGRSMAEADEQAERERLAAEAGEPAPEPDTLIFPAVAAAIAAGKISVAAGSAITRMLESVEQYVDRERIAKVERMLVAKAPGLTANKFAAVLRRHLEQLRSSAAEERQERLAEERQLTVYEQRDGMVDIRATLDPVSAAPVIAVLDSLVKKAYQLRRDDSIGLDNRTASQIRADALVTCALHMLGCAQAPISHTTTKVVVRIGLEELRRGAGAAEIDGMAGTFPASQLRRMGVNAGYLPMVLGGKSDVLDQGREERTFTQPQKIALIERDGGCAMCGAPPSYCQAHHIEWWYRDRGTSDLSNGVMLCVACHHNIHGGKWGIKADSEDVWFIPPPTVDPAQTPRLGGRAKFGLTRRERDSLVALGKAEPDDSEPPAVDDHSEVRETRERERQLELEAEGPFVGEPNPSDAA